MAEKEYRCEQCGSVMEFDVKTQKLTCPNCGNSMDIISEDTVTKHILNRRKMQTIKATEKTSQTMSCKSCGAEIEVPANSTATECPYCGTPVVLADKQADVMIPDEVVPFQIDKVQAGEIFSKWIGGHFFAPNTLKTLYQNDKVVGIYMPYWAFDAEASAVYSAEGGRDRQVKKKDKDGKEITTTVTDWFPTQGTVRHSFKNMLERGSDGLDASLLHAIGNYDISVAKSYNPDYFSGFSAESFSVDLEDAHERAINRMDETLESDAAQKVRQTFDRVRNVRIRPTYRSEKYEQVILPVYSTSFHYNGKQYPVVINGQTGRIYGSYPLSAPKIIITIIIVIALIAGLMMFLGGDDADAAQAAQTQNTIEYSVGEIDAEYEVFDA